MQGAAGGRGAFRPVCTIQLTIPDCCPVNGRRCSGLLASALTRSCAHGHAAACWTPPGHQHESEGMLSGAEIAPLAVRAWRSSAAAPPAPWHAVATKVRHVCCMNSVARNTAHHLLYRVLARGFGASPFAPWHAGSAAHAVALLMLWRRSCRRFCCPSPPCPAQHPPPLSSNLRTG